MFPSKTQLAIMSMMILCSLENNRSREDVNMDKKSSILVEQSIKLTEEHKVEKQTGDRDENFETVLD